MINTVRFRNRHFLLIDIGLILLASILSFVLRLEPTTISTALALEISIYVLISVVIRIFIFFGVGLYKHYWPQAAAGELILASFAPAASGLILILVTVVLNLLTRPQVIVPFSIPFIDTCMVSLFVLTSRFVPRAYRHSRYHLRRTARNGGLQAAQSRVAAQQLPRSISEPGANPELRRLVIIGAGTTGVQVLDALHGAKTPVLVVGFLDDDLRKQGQFVRGIRVIGKTGDLALVCQDFQVNEVIIAMAASGSTIREIADNCRSLGLSHTIVPSMSELVSGKITLNAIRPVSIADLLPRQPVNLDLTTIEQRLVGKVILITGAGGTIGSELARQLARVKPRQLILLGRGENSLFWTRSRLKSEFPELDAQIVLADVRDYRRLERLFQSTKPQLVFHAAAHKHVAMLEHNVREAISNNVLATKHLIALCRQYDVSSFVLISSDKAVEPSSVMGMSKRLAELLVLQAASEANPQRQGTHFSVIRFGNVLGSRGSVVPIFQQQIAQGGPITVTDFRATRYFMSISEAILLVLAATGLSGGEGLYVLNMGQPLRVLDLARELIRLSGLQPGQDIGIREIGLFPGEKLHEKLFWSHELATPLENGTIFQVKVDGVTQEWLGRTAREIPRLLDAAARNPDNDILRSLMQEIVFRTVISAAS